MKSSLLTTACLTLLVSTQAAAGGFDRGGVNIDQLFDAQGYSAGVSLSFVSPQRELKNVARGVNLTGGASLTASGVNVDGDYFVPQFGFKANLGDTAACLATYGQPFGADADYGTDNAYSPTAVRFQVDTEDYGLTCSYNFPLGDTSLGASNLKLIAGASYQTLDGFQSRQTFFDFANAGIAAIGGVQNTAGIGFFDVSGDAVGWRAGASYEIPKSAIRATLLYHSNYDYSLSGVQNNAGFATVVPGASIVPVTINTEIPQALELKLQTGINKSTLAFANFKWQQWSNLGIIPIVGGRSPVTGASTNLSFDPLYRDGVTVSAGVAKRFSDDLAGRFGIGWDRGTSTISGSQTDTWTFSAGLRWEPKENVKLSFGGLVGVLTSGASRPSGGDAANNLTYSFGNDLLLAGNASLKIKF